jgi:hypothetical protein
VEAVTYVQGHDDRGRRRWPTDGRTLSRVADSEAPVPKVFAAVPDCYWDLPEDERLAAAERLAVQIQEGLPHSS